MHDIVKNYGTKDNDNDIQVFYLFRIYEDNNSDQKTGGVAMFGNGIEPGCLNNIFINGKRNIPGTLAHELVHLLSKSGHYGESYPDFPPPSPGKEPKRAPDYKVLYNLMKQDATHNLIDGSKRIYDIQEKMIKKHKIWEKMPSATYESN